MTEPLHDISLKRRVALKAILKALPGQDSSTGRQRILMAIQSLGHCTTFEASRLLDVYDPRARKMELVRAGHPILTSWRHVRTEAGFKHRIGVYSLAK
ncbi:MAG: helix-turn-helix domain-containing protein [Aquabacterium sp.]